MENNKHFLIIDDHSIFSIGLKTLLKDRYRQATIDISTSIDEAKKNISHAYNIVFIDHASKNKTGNLDLPLDATNKTPYPTVIVAGHLNHKLIEQARLAGLSGAITKQTSPNNIYTLCENILNGGQYFDFYNIPETPHSFDRNYYHTFALTEKEISVLTQLKSGDLNKRLAGRLNITENTLRAHLRNIFRKMEVSNRTECVTKAISHGII